MEPKRQDGIHPKKFVGTNAECQEALLKAIADPGVSKYLVKGLSGGAMNDNIIYAIEEGFKDQPENNDIRIGYEGAKRLFRDYHF